MNNDGFKITVARYYSPSGANIDKRGIKPDCEVSLPEFKTESEEAYVALLDSGKISDYVSSHPDMSESQIASYAKEVKKSYNVDEVYIRKLIRNECDKGKPARLYDLDFDSQLKEALEILKDGRYEKLLKESRTLKETELAETEKEKASE